MSDRIVGRSRLLAAAVWLAAAALLVLAAPRAEATTVVNGDFETGSLSGWTLHDDFGTEPGSWFAYSGTASPIEIGPSVPPPPQGNFAAITAQFGPGLHILYQDVALEPGWPHVLSLIAYYESGPPIESPDSFAWEGEPNQQYRIDVIKPTAPIETLDPGDILATLLHTETGDPTSLEPKTLTADLSAFGGQTVRLRFAEVDNEGPFNAGVDAVSITGPPAPQPPAPAPPSNAFTFGKLKLNKKKGTATLKVNLPGAGKLTAVDVKKKSPKRVKKATATSAAPETVTLKLKPTGAGEKTLESKGKLQFKIRATFTPTGGSAAAQTFSGKLKLNLGG
ncbi:MAG TPA: hypothetical protein VFY75_02595 [Solirubrobacterales bacterium]|nr:hypothetical protein [Solirubrobacterales bacterium]